MARLINLILSYTKLGQFLDGKKTWIGALLLAISCLIEFVEKVAPMFPETQFLVVSSVGLKELLAAVVSTLDTLGYGALTVGLVHKAAKASDNK
jgi:hypothetical protein